MTNPIATTASTYGSGSVKALLHRILERKYRYLKPERRCSSPVHNEVRHKHRHNHFIGLWHSGYFEGRVSIHIPLPILANLCVRPDHCEQRQTIMVTADIFKHRHYTTQQMHWRPGCPHMTDDFPRAHSCGGGSINIILATPNHRNS
jgi:hypothetical protein